MNDRTRLAVIRLRRTTSPSGHAIRAITIAGISTALVGCATKTLDARPAHATPTSTSATTATSTVPSLSLGDIDLHRVRQEWGEPHKDRSVLDHPLSIGGKPFEHGLGTHAASRIDVEVRGATRFIASVGLDDTAEEGRDNENNARASLEFVVIGDGNVLFRSGVMQVGDAAKPIDLPVAGVKTLSLRVNDGGNGNTYDHADWADARLEYVGQPPVALDPERNAGKGTANAEVLTPRPGPAPRINGARVFGARPGSPVLIRVPCTGTRPIAFSIDGALPDGLALDPATGQITGTASVKGEFRFNVRAKNDQGEATRAWRIIIDDAPGTLAKTPPMGWNSWNVWGMAIDDAKVRAAADQIVSTGLIDHGWTYVNIDDGWQFRSEHDRDRNFAGTPRDAQGRINSNKKFPDMKALADYVHGKGLKVGLYSSPGTKTCGGVEASYGYEAEDAARYAEWGFDYLKYDWCSYADAANLLRRREHTMLDEHKLQMAPYLMMRDALRKQHRDIVYSLCQYGMNNVWEWGGQVDGQLWRTTGDINDSWNSMSNIGFNQSGHERFAKPGNWNDPDMLVVGYVGWGPNVRATKLSADEQYTHISLWAMLDAPLLIGCDLTRLDPFTIGLLTNDEVIDVNQDPLGKQASRVAKDGDHEIWAKPMEDGSVAVALFNRGDEASEIEVKREQLPIDHDRPVPLTVRDVWRQKALGDFGTSFKATVASHGVVLIRVSPKQP